MKRKISGLLVFVGAVAVAAALYGLTKPAGLPWGVEEMPFGATAAKGLAALPFWVVCAVAAGLLGALFNRYFGWKVGVAAALGWVFFPRVWNGAILGEPVVALAALGVVALFVLNAIMLFVFRRAIAVRRTADEQNQGTLSDADMRGWRAWINYLAGWAFVGAAALFAMGSLWLHDYRLGESASVFARGVVEEAGDRVIVMDGLLDRQIAEEVEKKAKAKVEREGGGGQWRALSLLKDGAYREEVVKWAKAEWPNETNLAMAAQVSVSAFVEVASRAHPERFYLMNGADTTPDALDRRWAAFQPYLRSSDRFVPVGRRHFAYEANAVANRLQEADKAAAWKLYGRIMHEFDWGNISAYINRSEMMRKGYQATERERKEVETTIAAFLGQVKNRRQIREIVQASGPVRADPELLARMAEEARRRVEQAQAAGRKPAISADQQSVLEMSDAMVDAANGGDLETAGRLARKILSNPQWAGWVPANAIMGDVSASEGDYVSSEAFYRAATSGTNETPAVVWNNYADTLMRLGKLDEAEAILRQQIAKTDEKVYVLRFTLAEVLSKQVEGGRLKVEGDDREDGAIRKEVQALVFSLMKNAPPEVQRLVRAKQKSGEILK